MARNKRPAYDLNLFPWLNDTLEWSPDEIWRDIPGLEGQYQVSNYLRVKGLKRYVNHAKGQRLVKERIMPQGISKRGYWVVQPSKNGKNVIKTVHKTYMDCFVPNPLKKKTINHKDGDKLNNRPNNLERATHGENNKHAKRSGLSSVIGETHFWATIDKKTALDIFNCPLKNFEIAIKYNVGQSLVGHIKSGKAWNHITNKEYVKKNIKEISPETVIAIFSALGSQRKIALDFGVSQGTVSDIKLGKTWSKITGKSYIKSRNNG